MAWYEVFIHNWKEFGGLSALTAIVTYFSTPKTKKAKEKMAEETAESQGLKNLAEIMKLNADQIERVKKDFESRLMPLRQIIENQKQIIENHNVTIKNQKQIINEQNLTITNQNKYISKLERLNKKYLEKFGELK